MRCNALVSALSFLICSHAIASVALESERLPILLPGGTRIEASILKPAIPTVGKLPALLIFGGFENAGDVLGLVRPEHPVVLASFDYPYDGPRKLTFSDAIAQAPALKQTLPDTIDGIRALVQELKKHPQVDPKRIVIVGASFGSPFAVSAAAGNPDVAGLVLIHGFADPKATLRHRLTQIWKKKLGWMARPAAWLASEPIIWYLDPPLPEKQARGLLKSQKALLIEAKEDAFIPIESRQKLWASIRESAALTERIQMDGDHLQPGATQALSRILSLVTSWMVKSSFLPGSPRELSATKL